MAQGPQNSGSGGAVIKSDVPGPRAQFRVQGCRAQSKEMTLRDRQRETGRDVESERESASL